MIGAALVLGLLVSCGAFRSRTTAGIDTPSPERNTDGLSAEAVRTLDSLERVDDYPLYSMHYYGSYETLSQSSQAGPALARPVRTSWACVLFAALADPEGRLYGRNFDWHYSPALLLFTAPPDGHASVSMVDLAYLEFNSTDLTRLLEISLAERRPLLAAPLLPFDGMNAKGLVVGMADVPPGNMHPDPAKDTIGSILVIREMLDHAGSVDEAVKILASYNIDMGGEPPLHYLVADASGRAMLVEFFEGQMVLVPNEKTWHLATNFLVSASGGESEGKCLRYDRIHRRLGETQGRLSPQDALTLLGDVSQEITQWSVVYQMSSGRVSVVMGRNYDDVHTFQIK